MADILIVKLGEKRFTWGGKSLRGASETRDAYIATLKAADESGLHFTIRFCTFLSIRPWHQFFLQSLAS